MEENEDKLLSLWHLINERIDDAKEEKLATNDESFFHYTKGRLIALEQISKELGEIIL